MKDFFEQVVDDLILPEEEFDKLHPEVKQVLIQTRRKLSRMRQWPTTRLDDWGLGK